MKEDIKFWRYSIPPVDRIEGWGIFILDSTGMFAAVTDYGNYAYMWDHYGKRDFREFVAGLAKSPYYILEKIAIKEYSGDKTIKRIKEDILDCRRDGSYSKEFARKEWDLIKDIGDMDNVYGFKEWYDRTHIQDTAEFYGEDWKPCAKAFATKLMPRLAEVLKAELVKEAVIQEAS
jgi:hypothetical protein